MEDIQQTIELLKNEELKSLWEKKSNAYNSMFNYLEKRGLKEKELICFSHLLRAYIQLF